MFTGSELTITVRRSPDSPRFDGFFASRELETGLRNLGKAEWEELQISNSSTSMTTSEAITGASRLASKSGRGATEAIWVVNWGADIDRGAANRVRCPKPVELGYWNNGVCCCCCCGCGWENGVEKKEVEWEMNGRRHDEMKVAMRIRLHVREKGREVNQEWGGWCGEGGDELNVG